MFKVTKKPLTPNIIWDAENNKPLCRFVKGVLETNDKDLADKLQELGHVVSGEADAPETDGDADDSANKQSDPNTDADADAEISGEADAAPKTNRRNRSK